MDKDLQISGQTLCNWLQAWDNPKQVRTSWCNGSVSDSKASLLGLLVFRMTVTVDCVFPGWGRARGSPGSNCSVQHWLGSARLTALLAGSAKYLTFCSILINLTSGPFTFSTEKTKAQRCWRLSMDPVWNRAGCTSTIMYRQHVEGSVTAVSNHK